MGFKMSLAGMRQTRAAVRRISPTLHRHLSPAMTATADAVAASARRQVPVLTGALRRAIAVNRAGTTGEARVGIARTRGAAGRDAPSVYAPLVEFGTSRSRGAPFMTPAAEGQRRPFLTRLRRAGKQTERDLRRRG